MLCILKSKYIVKIKDGYSHQNWVLTITFVRGSKECEAVEAMIRRYLYKSSGKFRMAIIDFDDNAKITGRSIPVSKFSL